MLNMNFSKQVVIHTQREPWLDSPVEGVARKRLTREAAESGHATSLVRYAPNHYFPAHTHVGGEEIFVLEGIFSDESGDHPAGSYLRNPSNSRHRPFSREGCVLFVKLAQFSERDRQSVRINTRDTAWQQGYGGLSVMPLHEFEGEHTALVKWPKNEVFKSHVHFGGKEIFVLSGIFMDEYGQYPEYSWLRSPHMSQHHPFVKEETIILVKTGSLIV
ncbi:cupin domain-containing protein [Shewanella surugensis]|uniref:Cupin domain-containing protein n=1 Tax=Shewanella surugensis TaxID=212020 RepID=A0ABT0LIK1_9GAMM|nr:cupin domain-containing protein [Shewanella surugensis]MCL1127195.1 cupin domain-containing protein [Shewanella surugensis]